MTTYNTTTDNNYLYFKNPNHTLEQCRWKKSDRDLKDKVPILTPRILMKMKVRPMKILT